MKSSIRAELTLGAEEGLIASAVTTFSTGPIETVGVGGKYHFDTNTLGPAGKFGNVKSDFFFGTVGLGGTYDPFNGNVGGRLSFGKSDLNVYMEADIADMGRFLVEVEIMQMHQQNIAVMNVINGVRSAVGLPDLAHPSLEIAKPLILDLDGDGVEASFGQETYFDWDEDGYRETGSWVGTDDGLLVIDLEENGVRGSGDGKIDQAREVAFALWGNASDTDLQALKRAFDSNCSIPDDHVSPRRSAFFMSRSVLKDIRDGVRPC
jgi:hypothetical protein